MSELILCIESSSSVCSVAISKGGELLDCLEENEGHSHAEHLHLFIKNLLEKNDLDLADFSAVAVSEGPGSYTGLRIGVSAAKGICFAKNIPLIAVATLQSFSNYIKEGLAHNVEDMFCPVIDARRMEIYYAICDSKGKEVRAASNLIVDEQFPIQFLNYQSIYFFGDGVAKCKTILNVLPQAKFISNAFPSARGMVKIAHEKFELNQMESLSAFEPNYIKPVHITSSLK